MSDKVDQSKTLSNDETFTIGSYHGIIVIIKDSDQHINATAMCKQFNKRFKKINENHAWQQYLEEFKSEYRCGPEMGRIIYELKQGHSKDLLGSYVDSRLINYIAFWASPKYAIQMGRKMDQINIQAHL
jgi:hypothetical protein